MSAGHDATPRSEDFVRRFAEAWANPTAESLSSLVHPDTENRYPPLSEPIDGAGVRAYFEVVLSTFPDLTVTVQRWAVRGNDVLIEWTASATAGGEAVGWSGADCVTLRGDAECRASIYYDSALVQAAIDRQLAGRTA